MRILLLAALFLLQTSFALAAVDLNSASKAELEALPGVGDKVAAEIINHRPYQSVDELKNVKGVGSGKKYDQIKGLVSVEPAHSADSHRAKKLAQGEIINLNTASQQDLEKLPGIGDKKAQAIIAARPFSSPEDLKKVKGIKGKTYEEIKDHITVK